MMKSKGMTPEKEEEWKKVATCAEIKSFEEDRRITPKNGTKRILGGSRNSVALQHKENAEHKKKEGRSVDQCQASSWRWREGKGSTENESTVSKGDRSLPYCRP